MEHIIVSRHPAAIEFIRATAPEFADAPVLAQASAEDVRGKTVAGNLPLHLAALAAEVVAVEFAGAPPRGLEYGLQEMEAAGARLERYVIFTAEARSPQYEIWPDFTIVGARDLKRMVAEHESWSSGS